MTAAEVERIRVFAALEPADRARLAQAAADIVLVPGEYAAHEGDERALFALLEGRIEAVKAVDGVERVVGERRPGDIFGEVPITLGTMFPVGFRSAERSRLMGVEPGDHHSGRRPARAEGDDDPARVRGAVHVHRGGRGDRMVPERAARSSSGSRGLPASA